MDTTEKKSSKVNEFLVKKQTKNFSETRVRLNIKW